MSPPPASPRLIDRALRLFGDVRPGEGARLLVFAVNLFFLLLAYYLLKTVREPLVLAAAGGGAEMKSYAGAAQAIVLVVVASGFGWLASHLHRMTLLTVVSLFFASNLVMFYILFRALPGSALGLGIGFYVWIGCFSVMVLSQFWAFANEMHTKDQGERLFGIIAGGSAIGSLVGAKIAKPLFKAFGPFPLMLIAAAILLLCLGLTYLAFRMSHGEKHKDPESDHDKPLDKKGGFALILHDKYLVFVGLLSLFKNLVNTTGEYILDRRLLEVATEKVGADQAARTAYIASFKSDYFTYTNTAVLALQLFAVSRLVKYIGVRRSLFILPIITLGGYTAMAFLPILTVILIVKVAENSTDYSLEKTVEQMLYLVTTKEEKYKAKTITDTLAVRLGDVATAALVWVGTKLHFSTLQFIFSTIVLIGFWVIVVFLLGRLHARKEASHHAAHDDPQGKLVTAT